MVTTSNFAQYQSIDLSKEIALLNPKRTPFLSYLMQNGKTTKAISNIVNWYEEELNTTAVQTLKEGADAPTDVQDTTSLMSNYTEILSATAKVSETAQASTVVGIDDLMAREINKKLSLLKDAIENKIMLGTKTAATTTDGQKMDGLLNMINSSNVVSGGTVITLTNFEDLLKRMYDSKTNDNMVCFLSDVQKKAIDQFSDVQYMATDNFLGFACQKYTSNYGDVTFVLTPSLSNAKSVVVVNPDYLELPELRAANVVDLAKTGDSISKMVVWEGALKLLNSKAAAKLVLA